MRRLTPLAARAMLVVLAGTAAVAGPAAPASAVTGTNWTAYLGNTAHTSYAPGEKTITTANAATVRRLWHTPGGVLASPVTSGGAVFVGTDTGYFEKINESTGAIEQEFFIGREPKKTCSANGVVSTATISGPDVYVAGPSGYLYALTTASLSLVWQSPIAIPSPTVSDYFNWSSPTIANGKIYVGISSHCDDPLVRGGEDVFAQSTGALLNTFYTVPQGERGGSIWSSAAVDPAGNVYLTTGNAPGKANSIYTEAIIKLSPDLSSVLGVWQIPASQETFDADFGGSPTLFGPYVGACDKNGIYYALKAATMKLAWERRVSAPARGSVECVAAAAYNGRYLFVAGNAATVGGTRYQGVVAKLTTSGKVVWRTGLPDAVEGSASLDGAHVLAVGTFQWPPSSLGPNATYLLNATDGAILTTLQPGPTSFSQSAFTNGMVVLGNSSGVNAYLP